MKSIDPLLTKVYNEKSYHCVHFAIEAAQYLFDADYSDVFIGLTGSLSDALRTSRNTAITTIQVKQPKDGTIVLMTNINGSSHVGLYYNERVLHLTEMGVHYLPLITLNRFYKRIRYYEQSKDISKSC